MQSKKNYLFPLSLLFCVVVAAVFLVHRLKSPDQQRVEFITNFYKNYLSLPEMKRAYYSVASGSFYSKGAEALIDTNANLCRTLSRSDDICGYGADGDVFLEAQEIDPKLTFAKARFRAIASGKNMVDVSFNVYPEYGSDYERKIRYVLVKEKAGWRVDDIFYAAEGQFRATGSMRYEINQENEHVLQQASDISDVADWVFSYLREADMLDRAERFIAFPVQLCSEAGSCRAIQKSEPQLHETMNDLHQAYYKAATDDSTNLSEFLPKADQVRALDGKVVKVDALDFTFRNKAWWLTKIDLTRLGQTIPVRRRREQPR